VTPTGYRTFSRKLAPALIGTGGALAVMGALGAWIRTSHLVTEGLEEEQVAAVMGYTSDWGRVMAAAAALAAVGAAAWLTPSLLFKLGSAAVALATVGLIAWRLPIINEQAAALAVQARTGEIDFISFHAGFGWGAWCLVLGAVALVLGVVAGILRELDVRRGVPE
jgi:hypothetical protein